jgi:hypothetical protein
VNEPEDDLGRPPYPAVEKGIEWRYYERASTGANLRISSRGRVERFDYTYRVWIFEATPASEIETIIREENGWEQVGGGEA